MRSSRALIAAVVALTLVAATCSSDDESTGSTETPTSTVAEPDAEQSEESAVATSASEQTSAIEQTSSEDTSADTSEESADPAASPTSATFVVQPGVNQIAVLGATPDETIELVAVDGSPSISGTVDAQGSFLWRELPLGSYVVTTTGETPTASEPVEVMSEDDAPDADFYADQELLPAGGFGYITTRDGTTLSANVMLPGSVDDGPYPTVVEYSGYEPSNPGSTMFGSLFNALGYAYVGVNIRGTGCSGGSYSFFERAQSIDGYDMIEAVAAQPWVLDHEVGMGGISYPGISQLFVASTRPPNLAAITPLSVLDDAYRSTSYPGGILNTGFATAYISERAASAGVYGQQWAKDRADAGDDECAANQSLRLQNPDLLGTTESSDFDDPSFTDTMSPANFVDQIEVPVFLAGAWQDEQTGGHFPDMLDNFTGSPHLYADLTNGLHFDALSPTIFARMVEFLDLYVAKRTPSLAAAREVAQVLVPQVFGVDDVVLPADRFRGMSYTDALEAFESEPPIRVLFEQGTGGAEPGAPYPGFATMFSAWPVPDATSTTWFLADNGVLATRPQTSGEADSYEADPSALPATFYPGGRGSAIWKADTTYDWRPIPANTGVAYATAPLDENTVVVGSGSVDLWIQSSADDTDLEVTISEIRPDSTETYVQSGWLRASHRKLDEAASTDVLPVQTHLEQDAEPLPPNEYSAVRIELFPFGHVFRAGSQIRITIDAPGNSRAIWEFGTISDGETVSVAHDSAHPSKIVLPVVPGIVVTEDLPECGELRGQPCRPYVTTVNEVLPIER